MIFAIGDVHGCADELRELLNRLPITRDSTVVLLGDYVDRGPSSRGVIDTILELGQRCNVVALKGNHEAMLLDYLRDPHSAEAGSFVYNGGSATLASYANEHAEVRIPDDHLQFLNTLKVSYATDHNVFVHAGLPQIPLDQLDDEHHEATMLWIRGKFLTTKYDWGKVVVHGHTPVSRVTRWPNRINIDTGCVYRGRLTAIALPSEARFSVKRLRQPGRVVLKDGHGTRAAHRFTGKVPVRVTRGQEVHELVTVDYSELGMGLRASGTDEAAFHEGERIVGLVGPESLSPVAFTGVIVRRRFDAVGVHYGVQIVDSHPLDPDLDGPSETPAG